MLPLELDTDRTVVNDTGEISCAFISITTHIAYMQRSEIPKVSKCGDNKGLKITNNTRG